MPTDRLKLLAACAVACSIVFGLGLSMAWWEGVRLDRIVLLILVWAVLLAVCGWLAWDSRRRSRRDA